MLTSSHIHFICTQLLLFYFENSFFLLSVGKPPNFLRISKKDNVPLDKVLPQDK